MLSDLAKNNFLVTWPVVEESTIFTKIGTQTITLDRDFGMLLGLYIGDGWCDKNIAVSPKIHIASIDINIINAYRDLVNKYLRDTDIVGYATGNKHHDYYQEYDSTHGKLSICIPSSIRDDMITMFGHGAYNKMIPSSLLQSPEQFRWGLLSGLIDTDGSISHRSVVKHGKTQQNKHVTYATQSWRLAQDVQLLCMSLGICASITFIMRKDRYEFTVIMGSIDAYRQRANIQCVSGKDKVLDQFTFGDYPNPKDILPFDKDIKSAMNLRYADDPSAGVLINKAVRDGYMTRETFYRLAPDSAVSAMEEKYNTSTRWERVLGIIPLRDGHSDTDLINKIKEVKKNVKKVA